MTTMSDANTTLGMSGTPTVSSSLMPSNSTEAAPQDEPRPWHVYLELVLLGIVTFFGLIGNLLVLRTTFVDLSRFARHSIILFLSLTVADLILSALRGPILIFNLTQKDGSTHDVICQLWLLSTVFVGIALFTSTTLALQRLLIVFSYLRYKRWFTFPKTFIIVLTFWIFLPVVGVTVYKILENGAFFELQHHVCQLIYDQSSFSEEYFIIVRSFFVGLFVYVPICLCFASYSAISFTIKRSGVKKLNKLMGNVDFSRVIILSCIRVALMVFLLAPFFLMVILSPRYPDTFLPIMRFFDYLLILYSAISPVITLNDFDFQNSRGRRTWLSMHFGGNNGAASKKNQRAFSMNISSADLKCDQTPD